MSAFYTKLSSGEWGLKIMGEETCEGEVVAVRKKNGSTTWETIQRVLYENDRFSICTIAKPHESGNYSELEHREGLREPVVKALYAADGLNDNQENESDPSE